MQADVSTENVTVVYDPAKTTPAALAAAITQHSGFKGSVVSQ
jgi:hypothetical protein